MESKERLYAVDNLKGVLIILVVLAHLYFRISVPYSLYPYAVIEVFCMPAWVFVSGYCCKKNEKISNIFRNYLVSFIIWQVIYTAFYNIVLDIELPIQFICPIWLLWYFLSLFFWHLMIRVFDTENNKKRVIFFVIAIAMALAIGYLNFETRILSISRTFAFFPFFILGYYLKGSNVFTERKMTSKAILSILTAVFVFMTIISAHMINMEWLYHAAPYATNDFGPGIRLQVFICAFIMLLWICKVIPNKRVKFLTYVGQNTLPIYVMHGMVVLIISNNEIISKFIGENPLSVYVCLVMIVLAFGNKYANFATAFVGDFPYKIIEIVKRMAKGK